jgi:excisionase family DNA binding protein
MTIVTPEEAAKYMRMSANTLSMWRSQGIGPRFIKTGRHVKYDLRDLDVYLRSRKVRGKT